MAGKMDAKAIADWAAGPLSKLPSLRWRMLEYWWQVELFMSPPPGVVMLGDHELPYVSAKAHRSKSLGIKWADLVFVEPSGNVHVVEMKDLGRSIDDKRLRSNALGVAKDLAALAAVDHDATMRLLDQLRYAEPKPADADADRVAAAKDKGRVEEYEEVHKALLAAGASAWSGAVVALVRDQRKGERFAELVQAAIGNDALVATAVTPLVGPACVIAVTVDAVERHAPGMT